MLLHHGLSPLKFSSYSNSSGSCLNKYKFTFSHSKWNLTCSMTESSWLLIFNLHRNLIFHLFDLFLLFFRGGHILLFDFGLLLRHFVLSILLRMMIVGELVFTSRSFRHFLIIRIFLSLSKPRFSLSWFTFRG